MAEKSSDDQLKEIQIESLKSSKKKPPWFANKSTQSGIPAAFRPF